jgi:hypothetical protein
MEAERRPHLDVLLELKNQQADPLRLTALVV